jgi:hypothetical protein
MEVRRLLTHFRMPTGSGAAGAQVQGAPAAPAAEVPRPGGLDVARQLRAVSGSLVSQFIHCMARSSIWSQLCATNAGDIGRAAEGDGRAAGKWLRHLTQYMVNTNTTLHCMQEA